MDFKIEVDKNTYDFSQLVLENYDKQRLIERVNKRDIEKQERLKEQRNNTNCNDRLDYQRFNHIDVDDVEKDQEYQKMLKENPYLQAYGCSHDRRKERQLYEKPTDEKLEAAERFKSEGNKKMKIQKYDEARFHYEQALIQFDYTFPENKKQEEQLEVLKESINNNMAQCYIFMNQNDKALIYLNQVIKVNSKNIKALYRKSSIFFKQDRFQECKNVNMFYSINITQSLSNWFRL